MKQKPMYVLDGPGTIIATIADNLSGFDNSSDCETMLVRYLRTTTGTLTKDIPKGDGMAAGNFAVQLDLAAKKATVTWGVRVPVKRYDAVWRNRAKTETNSNLEMNVLDGLTFDGDKENALELPLKETPRANGTGTDYYAVITLPFKFGPNKEYSGSALISFSITHKKN
jgi:hypothetical protein